MASSLNAQSCEDFDILDREIFVGNLPYSEDLKYDDYRKKEGCFQGLGISVDLGSWKIVCYIKSLEECLTNALSSYSMGR